MTRNAVIAYEDRRAAILAEIESVPGYFDKLIQTLAYYGLEKESQTPEYVISVMFNPSEIEDRKRAMFEEYATRAGLPQELRDSQLSQILATIPAGLLSEIADCRRDLQRAKIQIGREDIEVVKRGKSVKYTLNATKQAELLAATAYTLTDREQAAYEQAAEAIKVLRGLRDSYSIFSIVSDFIGDKMHPENDKPLEDIARCIHERRESTRAEILEAIAAREEHDRQTDAEIAAEIAAEREREQKKGVPVQSNLIRNAFEAVVAHHAAARGRAKSGNDE